MVTACKFRIKRDVHVISGVFSFFLHYVRDFDLSKQKCGEDTVRIHKELSYKC